MNKQKVNRYDQAMITVAIVALLWKYFSTSRVVEKEEFANEADENALASLSPINDDEDIDGIYQNLVYYFTSFNQNAYTSGTKEWKTLTDPTPYLPADCRVQNTMSFSTVPNFSSTSGFVLGANRVEGPFSNNLGIDFNGSYTIVLVFKNGELLNDATKTDEVELLKLYANSPNNNGLALYYQAGSLQKENNVQMGKLMFQFASSQPTPCVSSPNNSLFTIEKDVLSFVFIVKNKENVRIVYLSEKNDTLTTLANLTAPTTDVTFSNKEMFINRFKNWNANLYNISIFNKGLADAEIGSFYSRVKGLYSKFTDPNFKSMVIQYNALIEQMKCPFNKTLCASCPEITDWTDMLQIMQASKPCKAAIAAYCSENPKASFCKCWNPQSPSYSEESCKNVRGLIEGNLTCSIDKLSKKQLQEIKKLYKLTDVNTTVPKPVSPQNNVVYDNTYTFDKIKINYDEEDTIPDIPTNRVSKVPTVGKPGDTEENIDDIITTFEKSQKQRSFLDWLFGKQ